MHRSITLVFIALVVLGLLAPRAFAQVTDNIGHDRHTHHHNPKHATEAPTPGRFITTRSSSVVLPLPQEQDAFTFAVFGDRTGGPADGVRVLADAVRDTNLFEPDLVMTVGDLINGYNEDALWLDQCTEYKTIMNELRCPWFPVVGNHDVYWRGKGQKPAGEHDANYEKHFGPLWYAFEHKNCWFIALNSDETNPATGEKDFNKPANHRMSEEQFAWLKDTLAKAKAADHVFIFLHHPRWTGGNYGTEWDRVHRLLVEAGNVTAVFAGHIHRMRYDPRDGIEYVTLATVGGHQNGDVPQAGWLHHYHIITVRKQQVAMASIPVGEVMNVREITAQLAEECAAQSKAEPRFASSLHFSSDGAVMHECEVTVRNITSREIDMTVALESDDSRWRFEPDHDHVHLAPGQERLFRFRVERNAASIDEAFRVPALTVHTDVLMPTHRYALPKQTTVVPMDLSTLPPLPAPREDMALEFEGDDALLVDATQASLPDGPFTIECWMQADAFGARTGLLCKTEGSDYGIFVNNGKPHFSVHLNGAYANARSDIALDLNWHHIAGVFTGSEVRLYIDGNLVASAAASGNRKSNNLPLAIGADINKEGKPTSHFLGRIDAFRLSSAALYDQPFTPQRRLAPSDSSVLLSNFDARFGTGVFGEGQVRAFGRSAGRLHLVPAK